MTCGRAPAAEAPELLDGNELSPAERRKALADLARVNRLLFARGRAFRRLAAALADGAPRRLLDLGAGTGELMEGVAARARARGGRVRVVAVDRQLPHLLTGRERAPGQLRVMADARALPFANRAVDWAESHLFFHHFGAAENVAILAEMLRVSRQGVVVVDLRRMPLAPWLFGLLARILRLGPVASHDGRLSARRAWPLAAVRRLVAGLPARVRREPPCSFALEIEVED